MYIRRKVFSILTDEMGEERLYSVNETVLEGYEEREFAKKEEKKSHKGAKIAAGVAGTVGATVAGVYAAKKGYLGKKAADKVNNVIMKHSKEGGKFYEQAVKDKVNAHKKDIVKHAQEVVAKKHAGADKFTQKNISDALVEKNLKKAEASMRKHNPGRK